MLVAVAALASVLALVYAYRVQRWLILPSSDDYARLTLSREWGRTHFVSHASTYWLPLPIIANGIASGYAGSFDPWRQTIPAALAMLAAVLMLAWPHRHRPDLFNPVAAAAFLSYPIYFEITPSQLSEPFFAAGILLAARAAFRFDAALSRLNALLLLVALNPMLWVRYEAWQLAGCVWLWAWGTYTWRGRKARARRWRPHVLFFLGGVQLSLFPLYWMYLSHTRNGNYLAFLTGLTFSNTEGPPLTRLRWFLEWGFLESPTASVLGLAGLAVAAWRRDWKPLALLAALAFPFVMTIVRDDIGTVYHRRFAMGLHLGLAMLAGLAWWASAGAAGLRRRLFRWYIPSAAAAGLALSVVLSTALARPNGIMRMRLVAEEGRELMGGNGRALMVFTPWHGAVHDDAAAFYASFVRVGVLHENMLLDPPPVKAWFLHRWNFRAIFYRKWTDLSRVDAPLGEEVRLDLGWFYRPILPRGEEAAPRDE